MRTAACCPYITRGIDLVPFLVKSCYISLLFSPRSDLKPKKMKRSVCIIMLLLAGNVVFGQTESDDIIIYKKLLFKNDPDSAIIYADSTMGWDKILESLEEGYLKVTFGKNEDQKIKLTKGELQEIKSRISEYRNFVLPENLFQNSRRIPADSLHRFIYDQHLGKAAKINNALESKDYNTLKKLNGAALNWVHGFSKPVFFKDNTFCVVYRMAFCDISAGHESVTVLKNTSGSWEVWGHLYLGDW